MAGPDPFGGELFSVAGDDRGRRSREEVVVDAEARRVHADRRGAVGDHEGGGQPSERIELAGRSNRTLTQADMLVLTLDRPVRQEHPFDTAARREADPSVVPQIGGVQSDRRTKGRRRSARKRDCCARGEAVPGARIGETVGDVEEDRSAEAPTAGSAGSAITAPKPPKVSPTRPLAVPK